MREIELATDGTRRLAAYAADPAAGRAPGILMLHDMFGTTPPFHALAEDYVRRGHPVLMPNQFWRAANDGVISYETGHAEAGARLSAFDFDRSVDGMRLAIAELRRSPRCNGKVLALGFCFSGLLAFLAAARTDVDAAAGLYSLGIARYGGEVARIACPLQLHYGLADEHVPRSEVDAVAAAVAGRANIELYRYEGAGHSFFNPVRPTYHAAATALAARRIDALLARIA